MSKNIMKLGLVFFCAGTVPAFAADPVDLSNQNTRILRSFMGMGLSHGGSSGSDLKEIKQTIDFKRTKHVRFNQTYLGYQVWGGEAIVHVPRSVNTNKNLLNAVASANNANVKMNGIIYQNLEKDLKNVPSFIFSPEHAQKVLDQAIAEYTAQSKLKGEITNKESTMIVYIDDQNKAHWAFYVSFYIRGKVPAKPVYLVDAISLKPYEAWNDVKGIKNLEEAEQQNLENAQGGGFGGNEKIGKLIYDGLSGNLPKLDIKRDANKKICYLANEEVTVTDYDKSALVEFPCENKDSTHDNVYWDGELHAVNGGYSPDNDALYAGKVVIDLYKAWYGIHVLTRDEKPMLLEIVTHSPNYDEFGEPDPDNALWSPVEKKMFFGDGETVFYPLTSVGVTAHEVSHGFTEQHSNLYYAKQSGGMNESFSDMAAQAAEFFVNNEKNSWQIGPEIAKASGKPLRYIDEPSKDCYGTRIPGERCSIDKVKDYDRYVKDHRYDTFPWTRYPNVHYSSGVYNRVFYLMAKATEWGEYKESFKKAFNVMVKANQDHWTASSTFAAGACGVLSAANDLGYDKTPITRAFLDVGIDTSKCK